MNEPSSPTAERAWHPLCRVTAAATAVLIFAGALVTTTRSGLSVPDWPTTFGTFFPPFSKWVNGVQFEHTHRLIAGTVATLMLICGIWVWRREPRRGVRVLAVCAMLAVLLQALLGGLTVLYKLPLVISASHGTLAQTFFCLIVALSMVTSDAWTRAPRQTADSRAVLVLQFLAVATTLTVWLQLVVGALMRHLHAGLAIPDFPTSQGGLVPFSFTTTIAINFAHRVGALLVLILSTSVVTVVLTRFRHQRALLMPAVRLGGFVLLQITLGAFIVWTQRNVLITSLHVVNGALVLVTSLIVTLWAFRLYGPSRDVPAHVSDRAPASLELGVSS